MNKIKEYIKLIRVKHWFKNLLVFLPLIFSRELFDKNKIISCILAFFAFSFISSVVYIINDMKDIENDRKHPIKKKRPLASGTVKKSEGIVLGVVLLIISFAINFYITKNLIAMLLITLYLLLNIAYSVSLKKKPIIDIVILVSGFFIRVLYGAIINNIELSNWLYLTVISGSFYIGLGKRRNEIIKQGDKSREVLKYYTKSFLDKNMYVCEALCIVFYSLWCVDPAIVASLNHNYLVWSVPIVMIILMKYSLDIEGDSFGDPVDVLFTDKILLTIVLLYSLVMFGIIYLI